MGKTIEYRDLASVLNAYDMYHSNSYAVFHENNLKFHYSGEDGKDVLKNNLLAYQQNGSAGVFTIKFYEQEHKRVDSKTPYIGSFNFQLNSPVSSSMQPYGYGGGGDRYTEKLEQEIEELKEKVVELEAELMELEGKTEKSVEGMGKVGGILSTVGQIGNEYPWMQQYMGSIVSWGNKIFNVEPMHSAAINGLGNMGQEKTATPYPQRDFRAEELDKINKAVYVLQQHDDTIADDLYRLALLAENNPSMFKTAISMLRNMK